MSIDREAAFAKWWNDEGSAMRPLASEDTEEFAKRITAIAWSNGAYVERAACAAELDFSAQATSNGGDEYLAAAIWQEAEDIRAKGQA